MIKIFKAWLAKLDAESKATRAKEVAIDTRAKVELKETGGTLGIYVNGFLVIMYETQTQIKVVLDELTRIRNLAEKDALGEL